MATTSGVGTSGLDVNSIVSQLMAVEQQPLTALAKKEAGLQAKVAAFNSVSSAVTSFQGALKTLSDPDRYRSVNAISGDATIFTGAATTKAVAGNYNVNVTQLSSAQTLTSAGQTSLTAPLGDGAKTTLTFDFGTISGGKLANGVYTTDPSASQPNPSFTVNDKISSGTVVIDNTNNSLQGIRDAINKAGVGVTATIISDGSATPYHLVLTSNQSGAAANMRIGVARDAGAPADPTLQNLLGYDPAAAQHLTQTSAGVDTQLTVNGIAITSPKLSVEEAIQGVTLDVKKVGSSTLAVSRDTDTVKGSVNSFIKAFNDLNKAIKDVSSYDPTTKQAGLLLGDPAIRAIDTQVRSMLSNNLKGGALTNLTQIGITFQKDGTLAVDDSKLTNAVTNNFNDIAGLFASVGTTSDSLVQFTSSSTASQPGTYTLSVDQLATQGRLTGSAAIGSLTIAAGSNDQFAVSVDGVSATVTLAAKAYSSSTALATALQAAINSNNAFASQNVAVSITSNNNVLTIQSNRYGSASKVAIGGAGATNLLGATPVAVDGTDVKGSVDGVPGVGSGQVLTADTGSKANGIKLTILGGALGPRGTFSYSQGFAQQLGSLVDGYVNSQGGLLASQTDGVKASIKLLDNQQTALQNRLADTEKRLRAQYTALDATLTSLNNQQNYLTQQLNAITKNTSA